MKKRKQPKPVRTRRYFEGRPKINMEYGKQYRYQRRKVIIYHNTVLQTHGAECMLLFSWDALNTAVNEFNKMYGDDLSLQHGIILMMIKHYATIHRTAEITSKGIREFFPFVSRFVRGLDSHPMSFARYVGDLCTMHFLNKDRRTSSASYFTTTRLTVFAAMVAKHIKASYDALLEEA